MAAHLAIMGKCSFCTGPLKSWQFMRKFTLNHRFNWNMGEEICVQVSQISVKHKMAYRTQRKMFSSISDVYSFYLGYLDEVTH